MFDPGFGIRDLKNSDQRFGINISDPQHCIVQLVFSALSKGPAKEKAAKILSLIHGKMIVKGSYVKAGDLVLVRRF